MSSDPLTHPARQILLKVVAEPKGIKVSGRMGRKAARELIARGLASFNKSMTKLHATPAGRFAVGADQTVTLSEPVAMEKGIV